MLKSFVAVSLYLGLAVFSSIAYAEGLINVSTLLYDKDKFEGFLVRPQQVKKGTPAILMIHNWMGPTDETVKQAKRFAELGYIVMVADVYGKGVRPKDAAEAGKEATKFKTNRKLLRENLNIALKTLNQQKDIDTGKITAVGYCFGGTAALELVRSGAKIASVITFHGGLDSPTPEDGKNIKSKILALHGAIDPYVAETDLNAFEKEMKTYKVDYQFVKYANTVHSFTEVGAGTDNSKGAAYNASSDKRSFQAAKDFLIEVNL